MKLKDIIFILSNLAIDSRERKNDFEIDITVLKIGLDKVVFTNKHWLNIAIDFLKNQNLDYTLQK